jgi:adenine-specific DNA-methyltransferase
MDAKEVERLALQQRLDAVKTQAERNRLGQFATPTQLATDILQYAKSLLPPTARVRFLDPAFGTGAFGAALFRCFQRKRIASAVGYEVDPHYGLAAQEHWTAERVQLRIADFTRSAPPLWERDKATLVICNPPYVRHHHLTGEDKKRLQDTMRDVTETSLNGLAGLYCYFVGIAHAWMAKDALAGWLIPSEFMDVKYGLALKQYLLDRVTLLRIHRFEPQDVQFADAMVSSAVVWFKNASPTPNHRVSFSWGGTLAEPHVSRDVSRQMLRHARKWTQFPLSDPGKRSDDGLRLADFFRVKRGLATGANDFFVLTQEQVNDYGMPPECLVPILPSPRYLTDDEIKADATGLPLLPQRHFLLTCDLPEEKIRSYYPTLWTYLETGARRGLTERYICRHRSPWYAQEDRPAAPFLCTYMGRQLNGRRSPFRFLLNHSKATALNVYLMLYPRALLWKLLKATPGLAKRVWQALQKIPFETLLSEGRVYGGGLHKLEPKELGNASARHLIEAVPALGERDMRQPALFGE